MNNLENNKTKKENEVSQISVKEIVLKYFYYIPLFILSISLSVGTGFIYLRYKQPLYKANVSVFIKSGEDNSLNPNKNNQTDLINNALFGNKTVNLENEIELLKSKQVISNAVAQERFNYFCYDQGAIKAMEVYKQCPLELHPVSIPDSNSYYSINISNITNFGGEIEVTKNKQKLFFWNQELELNGFKFKIQRRKIKHDGINKKYTLEWHPIYATAAEIQSQLKIAPLNSKTTIISLNIQLPNVERGVDILNALVKEYNRQSIEKKNKISESTILFINERLDSVAKELNVVEKNLINFKNTSKIFAADEQVLSSIEQSVTIGKEQENISMQIEVTELLKKYLQNPQNKNKLVPSSLGLEDPTLKILVEQYNEIQLKKESEEANYTKESLQYRNLLARLEKIRLSLLENLSEIQTKFAKQLSYKNSKFAEIKEDLSSMPAKQILQAKIERQLSLKGNLYVYLLQRREETAIAAASTVSNYQQIDNAVGTSYPVEPKFTNIRVFSIIVGFALPIILIYLFELFNDKITTRDDIKKKTKIPIVGEVSHHESKTPSILVGVNRTIIAEQFRILRANLQFFLQKKDKLGQTILITSTISGEGKSFVSLNLAAVLSLSDKKVALLEFDLRKLRNSSHPFVTTNNKGITNILIGQISSPEEIISSNEEYPNLHLFQSGPLPPNPAEIMLNERVTEFFIWLRNNYDYIIIDSPPVGLVSDSFTLNNFADTVFYIVRQRFTQKRQLDFIQELYNDNKLTNMALVVNDVRIGGRYGYYGYGYGYGYSYGYGTNYLYGVKAKRFSGTYFGRGSENYFEATKKSKLFFFKKIFKKKN